MDNPNYRINWYAVLETKRLLCDLIQTQHGSRRIKSKPIAHHTCILYLQHQQSILTVMRAHARIRIRCERVQCEHMRMRAFASHCMRTHFSCVMRHASFAYVIWASSVSVMRAYARIYAHSHAMRAHSHRMRSHSHRMRSHRMRMRAFKGNLCVSGTVWWQKFRKSLTQVMACHQPLSEPMMNYSQLDLSDQTSLKYELKYKYVLYIKCT